MNFIAWIIKDFTTAGYSGFVSALIKSCLCCSLSGGQSFRDARKLSISVWSLSSFTELVSWQERGGRNHRIIREWEGPFVAPTLAVSAVVVFPSWESLR